MTPGSGIAASGRGAAGPSPRQSIRSQASALIRLAWPAVIARAGILTMALVDVAMVGRYDPRELAYAALGVSVFVPLLVTGVGLMAGVAAVTAQRFGAGRAERCGEVWLCALPWAALTGLAGAAIALPAERWFLLFGHSPEMAREGGLVAVALTPGLAMYGFFVASTFFLEGLRRPGPGMAAMLVANVLNILLNWLLIYGALGAPELGAVGSAVATSLVRIFLAVALVVYILRMRDRARFGLAARLRPAAFRGWWARSRRARRIGLAAGASGGVETVAHAALMQFAGLLGAQALAAYAIAHNLESTLFMAALGLGSATGVLVANAWGRGDAAAARLAAWTGLGLALVAMSVAGAAIALGRNGIAAGYAADSALAAAAAPLIALAGLVAVADGAQMAMSQAVRGLGDAWAATWRYVLAFWVVMAPLGWVLSGPAGLGTKGLMLAIGLGCLLSLVLQAQRFAALLRAGPPAPDADP